MRGLTDLVLPPACACCRELLTGNGEELVCGRCLAGIASLTLPLCERCGHPRLSPNVPVPVDEGATAAAPLSPCRWCPRLPPWVRAVRSVCRMDQGTGSAFVHALKYEGWRRIALPMARRMARLHFPLDVVAERTALVPVPLSASRRRERGYNQAEMLADALGELWKVPVWTNVVERVRSTTSQVRLTPSDRAANVAQAFATSSSAVRRLSGAHIVLVDDVVTTAATLNATAQTLIGRGVRIVSYVTFGRAPEAGDRSIPDLDLDQD
jgi:ComF family protein